MDIFYIGYIFIFVRNDIEYFFVFRGGYNLMIIILKYLLNWF